MVGKDDAGLNVPVILAHGALGWWDEIIFAGVVVIFLVMMGISWVRSRSQPPEFDATRSDESPVDPARPSTNDEQSDRFRLD